MRFLGLATILMMMQKKIIRPELQPMRALSCLLSTMFSLEGSRGVRIL